jgi:FtsP/CotA-like multicopper oxidase with cupredoxin domain
MRLSDQIWFCGAFCFLAFSGSALADDPPSIGRGVNELQQPRSCSAFKAVPAELSDTCQVTTSVDKRRTVTVKLEAQTKTIEIGGYLVRTENYGTYVPPVVEAGPGDTVGAHLTNSLDKPLVPSPHAGHGHADENPTNLHYFHGGVVSPGNSYPMDARKGTGDNIYVYLKRGSDFQFSVPIPDKLDAAVLEGEGEMEHPPGLNWYHSHLHGISSNQVMGGLSGLLSVGEELANVKAACKIPPEGTAPGRPKCTNSVGDDTATLRGRTKAKYVLLRDISLNSTSAVPIEADGTATATWAPHDVDSPRTDPCGSADIGGISAQHPELHLGFCLRNDRPDPLDPTKMETKRAWLFTLNGQRFPQITVTKDSNTLLRMGNLSPNTPYWLELECETGCGEATNNEYFEKVLEGQTKTFVKLQILSLDGVVPANFKKPGGLDEPTPDSLVVDDFLLMPASRVELYLRNDRKHATAVSYVLRAKKLDSGGADVWPEIQLARIVLEPTSIDSNIQVALNAPLALPRISVTSGRPFSLRERKTPARCVRDLEPETDPAKREHRRVTFLQDEQNAKSWTVATEIVKFPETGANPVSCKTGDGASTDCIEEKDFVADLDADAFLGKFNDFGELLGIPFESYDKGNGEIDWEGEKNRHVCITPSFTGPNPVGHKQLWVLYNATGTLHNFHIHQMKFRLATEAELTAYRIKLPARSSTCPNRSCNPPEPDYRLYDDRKHGDPEKFETEWHDTIPMPAGERVFIVMSFDAKEQLGRYVYHCHILKHEDLGLMVPIEVLDGDNLNQ